MGHLDDAYDDEMSGRGAYEDRGEYSGYGPPVVPQGRIRCAPLRETERAFLVSGLMTREWDEPNGRVSHRTETALAETWIPKSASRWTGDCILIDGWLAARLDSGRRRMGF